MGQTTTTLEFSTSNEGLNPQPLAKLNFDPGGENNDKITSELSVISFITCCKES